MTQREKLIELIHEFGLSGYEINDLANYLLDRGVVVLPCKVGDTVYETDGVRAYEERIKRIVTVFDVGGIAFDETAIGERVFLVREEAEAALKKMEGEK